MHRCISGILLWLHHLVLFFNMVLCTLAVSDKHTCRWELITHLLVYTCHVRIKLHGVPFNGTVGSFCYCPLPILLCMHMYTPKCCKHGNAEELVRMLVEDPTGMGSGRKTKTRVRACSIEVTARTEGQSAWR